MGQNIVRLEKLREGARGFVCPVCAADIGRQCLNSRGEERISVHQARLLLFRPDRDPARREGAKLEVVGDSAAEGYVVYAIRDKENGRFGYVGQTGNFARRIKSHSISASRGSTTKAVAKWMYSVVSGGGTLEIVLLQNCSSEEHSLLEETEWVRKLAADGHLLTNRWKDHQQAIAEGRALVE